MNDKNIIINKNETDFTKFILYKYNEFISNILYDKNINGNMFIKKGGRCIAIDICNEYDMTKGPFIQLCQSIENYILNNNVNNNKQDLWNDIQCIKDCNNKQILLILKQYILPKLMDKQIIHTHKDKIIEYFETYEINGKQLLETMNRKEFGEAVTNFVGDKKLKGSMTKIYSIFQKFDMSYTQNIQESEEINLNNIKSIKECTAKQIVYIIDKYILNKLNKIQLDKNRDKILDYFMKENLNGNKLFQMNRKEFGANIIKQCNGNNKLNGAAMKLLKSIKEFDIINISYNNNNLPIRKLSVSPQQSETNLLWNDNIKELKQCSYTQIIFILNEYIFKEINELKIKKYDTVRNNKELFIQYFEDKKLNGEYLCNIDRKIFGTQVVEYANNNLKLKGPSLKLLKLIKDFEFNKIITGAHMNYITLPLYVEECTNEQLIYLLQNYILNDDTLKQHKDIFIGYFIDKTLDGKTLKQMKRKSFGSNIVEYVNGNKKLYGPAMKLFNKINNYKDLKDINIKQEEKEKDKEKK
eukprot:428457_1